jgi:hypothetical protein
VIVDDTAVILRYVRGCRPERELPMIKRIAIGSLRNKLLVILPAALVLSELLDWRRGEINRIVGSHRRFTASCAYQRISSPSAKVADQGRRTRAKSRSARSTR